MFNKTTHQEIKDMLEACVELKKHIEQTEKQLKIADYELDHNPIDMSINVTQDITGVELFNRAAKVRYHGTRLDMLLDLVEANVNKKVINVFEFKDQLTSANSDNRIYYAVMTDTTDNAVVIEMFTGKTFAQQYADKLPNACVRMGMVDRGRFIELD